MDPLLAEAAGRILADRRDDPAALWAGLEENGFDRAWVSEEQGGFGLSAADGFGLIRLVGYHAAAVPLPETMMASWLLAEAGLRAPEGPMSVFITGYQNEVAFGALARHVVSVEGGEVSLHPGPLDGAMHGVGLDPASPVPTWDHPASEKGEIAPTLAPSFAALVRSAQICGALDAALDLTIAFAMQREQFGRSLSKFQAIQHLLSEMGAEAAAASAAVDAGIMQVRRGAALDLMTVGVAKYRAGLAAGIVAEHAHQIHGAIGYTEEYGLARLTRRLWKWREDFGGESWWANELGRGALAGSEPLWPRLTRGRL